MRVCTRIGMAGKARAAQAGDYLMNAVFFDGHTETLNDMESARPEFWLPTGQHDLPEYEAQCDGSGFLEGRVGGVYSGGGRIGCRRRWAVGDGLQSACNPRQWPWEWLRFLAPIRIPRWANSLGVGLSSAPRAGRPPSPSHGISFG